MVQQCLNILIPCLLLSSTLLNVIAYDVNYIVTNNVPNTPGGKRFETELGDKFTINLLRNITSFIWDEFQQVTDTDKNYVPIVNVTVDNFDDAWATTTGNHISISAPTLQRLPTLKFDFIGLMYHETTHVFQWNGEGTTPVGLIEGIAEYTKLKSKYYHPDTFPKLGDGNKWDEGYGQTARFLEYCDGLKQGFVADLNKEMKNVYKEEYFKELLGKPVNQLWEEYKAKYGKTNVYYEPPTENWKY